MTLIVIAACVAALLILVYVPRAWQAYQWKQVQPVRHLDYWKAAFAKPLEQRIGPADTRLIDYIYADSLRFGGALRVTSFVPDAALAHDLAAAVAGLPPEVRRAAADKLAGIYLIAGISYSGITYEILGAQERPVKGVILINAHAFDGRNANEWLSWKESDPFDPGSRWRLSAKIEMAAENTRVRGLQFLILHEIGHLLAIGTDINPPFGEPAARFPPVAQYPFVSLSWRDSRDQSFETRNEEGFPLRHKVFYYGGPKLNGNTMEPIYRSLQQTGFATLYGATDPWDDFAETFATYVHTQLQHRHYAITVYHDDAPVLIYHSCWEEGRCEAKRAYMERVLAIGQLAGGG
ncbi:MAG TPA: hypothetical protein VGN52_08505 [Burkholderiales bacterium]